MFFGRKAGVASLHWLFTAGMGMLADYLGNQFMAVFCTKTGETDNEARKNLAARVVFGVFSAIGRNREDEP